MNPIRMMQVGLDFARSVHNDGEFLRLAEAYVTAVQAYVTACDENDRRQELSRIGAAIDSIVAYIQRVTSGGSSSPLN